jgi:hypothetical protein
MALAPTLFDWAGLTPPWPNQDRAALTTNAARPNIKQDARRRAMLLAKRAELRAVRDVLISMHAHEMAFKVEKAAVADDRSTTGQIHSQS